MKYLESLEKRGLSVENLPKTLQKKIKDLDYQLNTLKEVEESASQDLTESDLTDIEVIKASINELDKHISHKVNIFDQAKYDDKLAKIGKMTKIKQGIKEADIVEEKEVEVQEPEVANVTIKEETPKESTIVSNQVKKEQVVENQVVEQDYTQGRTQAISQVEEPQLTEEHEEYERQGEGNPKKMTTGLILMGVGAFFLTWGAVNFFKSRR